MRSVRTALLVFIVMAMGVLAWSHRLELLASGIARAIESAGFGPSTLTLVGADLGGLALRDLAFPGGRAEELEVRASPTGLLEQRVDSLEVRGLRLTLGHGDDGVSLGGRPLHGSSEAPTGGGTWRIDRLVLDDTRIQLELGVGDLHSTLDIELPNASLVVDETGLRGRIGGGRIGAAGATWKAGQIAADLAIGAVESKAHIVVGRLTETSVPALLAPSTIAIDIGLKDQKLDFAIDADILTSPRGRAGLEAKGQHDLAKDAGRVTIVGRPIVLEQRRLRPADLTPAFAPFAASLTGSIGLSGQVGWQKGRLVPDLVLKLADVALAPEGVDITSLAGTIRIDGLDPPSTPPGQTLTAKITAAGLGTEQLSLRFELRRGPLLHVERLELSLAGGRVVASPFSVGTGAPQFDTLLEVEQVDLGQLIELIGVAGASGTGRISGRLPIQVDAQHLLVTGGALAADAPGILRLQPGTLPAAITTAREEMALAAKALEEFHYERLALEVDKGSAGEGVILAKLSGANPAVLDGRRFDFNIRLESDLDRLTGIALRSIAATTELLRRAEGRARP